MRYIGHRASETNPLRSLPLLRPVMRRTPAFPMTAALHNVEGNLTDTQAVSGFACTLYAPLILSERKKAERNLANAEAALREAIRCYDAARRGIGEANGTRSLDLIQGGRVIMPGIIYSTERIRARKSAAFRLFNQRRRELTRDRRGVEAARAALGLPLLAEAEEREARAKVVRASKRHRPAPSIAQAAMPV